MSKKNNNGGIGTCICCLIGLAIIGLANSTTQGITVVGIIMGTISVVVYLLWKKTSKAKPYVPQPRPYTPYIPPQPRTTSLLKCLNCGFENSSSQTFCGRCGNSLNYSNSPTPSYPQNIQTGDKAQCARCGHITSVDNRFCGRCGASMEKGDETKIY
jgi:uncharacterized paraquat-inducible protein A